MILLKKLAERLNLAQTTILNNYYRFETNLITLEELLILKNIFLNKKTNCGLIKARKIEKIIFEITN